MSLSDELPNTDALTTSVVAKIVDIIRNLLNSDRERLLQHIQIDGKSVNGYLMTEWRWNDARYDLSTGLREIAGLLTNACFLL